MESEKRVILICNTDKELVAMCESIFKTHSRTQLIIYSGQDDISAFLYQNSRDLNPEDDMLIIIDSSCYFMTVEEAVTELRSNRICRKMPVLVLINEVEKDVIRSWYEKHISSVVLKSEDKEGMTCVLKHIIDFWHNTTRLPVYTMPDPNRVFGAVENNLSFEL